MSGQNKIVILATILLTSCGRLHPPDWLHGQWKNMNDSLSNKAVWTIGKDKIYFGDYKIESTFMINKTEIVEHNRYVIRYEHSAEQYPYFQIFMRPENNNIIYYDSSNVVPRKQCTLTKIQL